MYHEKKMINGSLMWRGSPRGEWKPCTTAQLNTYIGELEGQLRMERTRLADSEQCIGKLVGFIGGRNV